ncbi:DUF3016 domain-containing protein [Arenibaculum pallidiluteum]|uniref:DUF3016 domain-containing protein n=1 Tax=Arenibaculum pallidiluteum TaxID=2812559 RepID=UPI001A975D4E|nr:DUF3016 domain-containing protein [Arenibaculum pallidiluteum]
MLRLIALAISLPAALLAGVLAAARAAPSDAAVSVVFEAPGTYADLDLDGTRTRTRRETTLEAIRRHLEQLGERHLAPGQALALTVLDIDLAGRIEWWRPFADHVRVLQDATWPRMRLRYELRRNGQVLAAAEETVSDPNYLMGVAALSRSDALRYEKAMLDEWFRRRFSQEALAGTSPGAAAR